MVRSTASWAAFGGDVTASFTLGLDTEAPTAQFKIRARPSPGITTLLPSRSSLALPVIAFPIRTPYPELPFQKPHHLSGHFSHCPKIPRIVQVRAQVRFQGKTRYRCTSSPLLPPGEGETERTLFILQADPHRTAAATISIFAAVFDCSGNGLVSREQAPNRNEARVFAINVNSVHRALSKPFPQDESARQRHARRIDTWTVLSRLFNEAMAKTRSNATVWNGGRIID